MIESPTLHDFANDPPSVRNLRDELSRETRTLLQETRRALEGFSGRLAAVETEVRHLGALRREFDEAKHQQQEMVMFCQELRMWRATIAGPIEAATKLDAATHGARMAVIGVFTIATCILAVSGVLTLISNAWSRFTQ